MRLVFLSTALLSTIITIKCAENYANADFYTQQFYRLKQKFDNICKEPGTVIEYKTAYGMINKCLEPEMEAMKKNCAQQIPDSLYPEHWQKIIEVCFKKRVKNFCLRTVEGKMNRNRSEWTIDQALYCAGTKSYAFLDDLKKLYKDNSDKVKEVAERQKKCLDDYFDNVTANKGKYTGTK